MTFKLPNKKTQKWLQTNETDVFGTIAYSKNIDLDKPGYLKLAKRARPFTDASVLQNMGYPVCINYWAGTIDDEYYTITESGKGFITDGSTLTTVQDYNTNVPTFDNSGRSDALSLGSCMYASAEDGVHRYFGTSVFPNSWDTTTLGTVTGGGGGPLCHFVNKNGFAWGDANLVKLYTGEYPSETLSVTLTLPTVFYVTCLAWSSNYLFIGTRHRNDGQAQMFVWDGADTTYNTSYPVGTHRIQAIVPYGDSVAITTSDGQLLKFTGGGFQQLGAFPIYYTDHSWEKSSQTFVTGRVLPRGMVVENDLIFINVSGAINISSDDDVDPALFNDFPSGVWCFDPNVGLYHRYSLSGDLRLKTSTVSTASVNTTTDVIAISGQVVPYTGTPVIYDDGSDGVGTGIIADGDTLKFREPYYTIYVSDTTFKLASSRANALAGTAMDITGTGNNAQYFIFQANRDFGGLVNSINGAITILGNSGPGSSGNGLIASDGRRIMFSGYAYQRDGTSIPVLCIAAENQENRGYFVTTKLPSDKIRDSFQNITVRYDGLKNANDTIVVKYRVVKRDDRLKFVNTALQQKATWIDGTSFTTTYDLSDAQVGDEIEFHAGTGGGYLAHITSLTDNSGTWTVEIDETVENVRADDLGYFTIDNWEKLGTITTADNDTFQPNGGSAYSGTGGVWSKKIDKNAHWLQIKVELRGEDVSIGDILINNRPLEEFTA